MVLMGESSRWRPRDLAVAKSEASSTNGTDPYDLVGLALDFPIGVDGRNEEMVARKLGGSKMS